MPRPRIRISPAACGTDPRGPPDPANPAGRVAALLKGTSPAARQHPRTAGGSGDTARRREHHRRRRCRAHGGDGFDDEGFHGSSPFRLKRGIANCRYLTRSGGFHGGAGWNAVGVQSETAGAWSRCHGTALRIGAVATGTVEHPGQACAAIRLGQHAPSTTQQSMRGAASNTPPCQISNRAAMRRNHACVRLTIGPVYARTAAGAMRDRPHDPESRNRFSTTPQGKCSAPPARPGATIRRGHRPRPAGTVA